MARKSPTRNPRKYNRVDIFGPVLETDAGVADTRDVAHGHIDSEDADRFRVVSPRYSMRTAPTSRTNRDLSSNHYRPETEAWDDRTEEAVETVESTVQDD